jgi:hypothetical protein
VARLSAALVSATGGYLRNPIRQYGVTCAVCTTPSPGYERCRRCERQRAHAGLADRTAFLAYAVAGHQSGYVMRGYKAQQPVEEHVTIVAMLVLLGLAIHARCPAALAGAPVTRWATVPSLPARPGEHPLHRILRHSRPTLAEIALSPAPNVRHPREVSPDHYRAGELLAQGSHVLLLDDTWASGGHVQSAVLALRRAGASHVSVLAAARWIREDFGGNAKFLRDLSGRDYNPYLCPWTGTTCPP